MSQLVAETDTWNPQLYINFETETPITFHQQPKYINIKQIQYAHMKIEDTFRVSGC